ncbi:ParA family protein [Salinibacter ruber]|uniref:ParA family protein n=1 Tax=Salinibacter ruber TaxID=146919 RepID=UPI000E6CF96E|nr:ParA family protein [Salinibacter ruber]
MTTPDQILVHNHKGGTGKTMLSVHLAHYFARQEQEWCLWDADRQGNAISWLTEFEWDGTPTIRLSDDGMADLIATVKEEDATSGHERLLVDTPPSDDTIEKLSPPLELGPETLLVCPVSGRLSVDGAVKVAEEVASNGCRVLLVANLTDPKETHAREEIHALEEMSEVKDLNAEVFQLAIPRNDKYMREAEEKGIPIWDLPHSGQTYTGKALRAFCEWVYRGALSEENPPTNLDDDKGGPISSGLQERLWS